MLCSKADKRAEYISSGLFSVLQARLHSKPAFSCVSKELLFVEQTIESPDE